MQLIKISILIIIFYFPIFAQDFNLSLSPSVYYTKGTYSKTKSSTGYSAYTTIGLDYSDFITLGYDKTAVKSLGDYTYDQNYFIISGLKTLFPYYIKANYGYLTGKYKYIPEKFNFSETTNLFNLGVSRYFDMYYIGLSMTYSNKSGYTNVAVYQPSLSFDYVINNSLVLNYKSIYTKVDSEAPIFEDFLNGETSPDDRSLLTHLFAVNYYYNYNLFFRFETMLGKSAYYFNTDYLTFYNQEDTQKFSITAKIDYEVLTNLRLNLTYNYLTLDHSKIIYYSVGIKYNIWQL